MDCTIPVFHEVMPDPLNQQSGMLGWIDLPSQSHQTSSCLIAALDQDTLHILAVAADGELQAPHPQQVTSYLEKAYPHLVIAQESPAHVLILPVNLDEHDGAYAISTAVPQQHHLPLPIPFMDQALMNADQVVAYATPSSHENAYALTHTLFDVPQSLQSCSLQHIYVAAWAYWGRSLCSLAFLDAPLVRLTHDADDIESLAHHLGLSTESNQTHPVADALKPAQHELQKILAEQLAIDWKMEAGIPLDTHEYSMRLALSETGLVVAETQTDQQVQLMQPYTVRLNAALIAAERLMLAPKQLTAHPGIQALACESAFARCALVAILPARIGDVELLAQTPHERSIDQSIYAARLSHDLRNHDEASMRISLERSLQGLLSIYEPTSFTYSLDPAASALLVETSAPPINVTCAVTACCDNLTQCAGASKAHRTRLYEMTIRMQTLLFARWGATICPHLHRIISVVGKGVNHDLELHAHTHVLAGIKEVYTSLEIHPHEDNQLHVALDATYGRQLAWHLSPIDTAAYRSDWQTFAMDKNYHTQDVASEICTPQISERLRHEHLNFSYHRNALPAYRMTHGLYDEQRHVQLTPLQTSFLTSVQEKFDTFYSHQKHISDYTNRRALIKLCTKIHKLLRVTFGPFLKTNQHSYLSFSSCATYHLYQQRVDIPSSVRFVPYTLIELCIVMMDIYEALEMYQAARSLMPPLLRLAPGDLELYLQCANLCIAMQEFDMAAQYLDEAAPYIFCDDHVWAAYSGWSSIAAAKGHLEEAYAWQLLAHNLINSPLSKYALAQLDRLTAHPSITNTQQATIFLTKLNRTLLPLENTVKTLEELSRNLVNARLYGDADIVLTDLMTVSSQEELTYLMHSLLHSELGREYHLHQQD